ncbi:MAG TPA: hypothetical protein VD710_04050 [Nitrososphaeraceae archaeon]|nr:hypothetical protein [Nitrososphaeraceae archaeon]
MSAKSAHVLRQQPDGTLRFVIDNPWERTNPQGGIKKYYLSINKY